MAFFSAIAAPRSYGIYVPQQDDTRREAHW